VQVNVAGEASKHGVPPRGALELVRTAARLPNLEVAGLMTVPPIEDDRQRTRRHFRALADLAVDLRARTGLPLPELSMGMSGDFEIAIEEGATLVRVGSAVFGARGP
jgi:uncharacterized pyridoxal phosphate-containing UPF0001 family protein